MACVLRVEMCEMVNGEKVLSLHLSKYFMFKVNFTGRYSRLEE